MSTMARHPKLRHLTYHDYRALPEMGPRYQLIRGALVMAPAPNPFHQQIIANLFRILGPWIYEQGLGKLYVAPFDVQLTDIDVYQPDLSFFAANRLNVLTDAGAEGPPSLVVEVLSPRTARFDREMKRDIYARTGVEERWLVEPDRQRVEVYRLQEDPSAPIHTLEPSATLTSPLLGDLTLDVTAVFED